MTKHWMSEKVSLHQQFSVGVLLFYGLLVILSLFPDAALAGYIDPTNRSGIASGITDPITHIFKIVVESAVGTTGKAISTVAIIVVGIAALLGKVSWGQALIVSAGVALVFGSISLMNSIVGSNVGATAPGSLTCSMPFSSSSFSSILSVLPVSSALLTTPLNPACGMMMNLVNTIQSELAAGIGSLFVLFLGLAALFGRVSWPQAAVLAAGIGLIFGAVHVVNSLWLNPLDCNLQVGGIVSSVLALGASPPASAVLNAVLSGVTPEFVMCQFLMIMQGGAGKLMATFAVIIMGFLAMLGKISWQYAVVVMVGIATVFGSHQILTILVPGSVSASCLNALTPWTIPLGLGPIERVLCDIHHIITGPVGKALASCAIIMLGFGAMIGKVSYHAALVVAIGIAITFGAPQIVLYLTLAIDVCALPTTVALPSAVGLGICNTLFNTIFR